MTNIVDAHAAALQGDAAAVQQYVREGGDPNLLNDAGITPLHSAAVQGQEDIIRILVAAGADTDLKVSSGQAKEKSHDASPLILAVVGGYLKAAQALLEAGAEVGAKNNKGLTPLHVCCLKPNAPMARLLLLWGADINARDRKKRVPEQIIGRMGKGEARDPVAEEAVRTALKEASDAKRSAVASAIGLSAKPPPPLPNPGDAVGNSTMVEKSTPTAPEVAATLGNTSQPGVARYHLGAFCVNRSEGAGADALPQPPPPPPPPKPQSSRGAVTGSTKQYLPSPTTTERKDCVVGLLPPAPPLDEAEQSTGNRSAYEEFEVSTKIAPKTATPPAAAATAQPTVGNPRTVAPEPSGPEINESSTTALPMGRGERAAHGRQMSEAGTGTATTTKKMITKAPPSPAHGDVPVGEIAQSDRDGAEVGENEEKVVFSCGMVLEEGYELEKAMTCSSGSSEIWYASQVFTGEQVVIKRVVDSSSEKAFQRERAVLKFLQRYGMRGGCQHSAPFLGVIPSLRCLVLGRGARNLRQIGQRFYQRCAGNTAAYMDRIRPFARQVVEICQWLHMVGVVWGDAKPENFVEFQDGDLKAVDFDSACTVAGGTAARDAEVAIHVGCSFEPAHVLTPRYCAPERAKMSASGESFPATKTSDLWSIGMVLFWLLTGQDYFEEGLPDAEVVQTLCSPGFTVSLAGVAPKQEQARNVLETMLSREPARRGTADGVLCRAFFAGGASVSAAKLQADVAASLGDVSLRLEATIREEGGSTRSLLDESMKRLESRADEILGRLGRIDCILESIMEGDIDCPRLFILTPTKESSALWKPDTWFTDCNVLRFLCAHDLMPVGEGIKIPCPRMSLEKWAPAIQASAFVLKLGCKAACMTAGVTPAAVDGMSAALGVNFLAGQQVATALRSAADKTLGEREGGEGKPALSSLRLGRESLADLAHLNEEKEGKRLTGEAYEALVAFLDNSDPSWRAKLKRDMVKAVRGDGKVSWICHEHAALWTNSCAIPANDRLEEAIPVALVDTGAEIVSTTAQHDIEVASGNNCDGGSTIVKAVAVECVGENKAATQKSRSLGPRFLSKLKGRFGRQKGGNIAKNKGKSEPNDYNGAR